MQANVLLHVKYLSKILGASYGIQIILTLPLLLLYIMEYAG